MPPHTGLKAFDWLNYKYVAPPELWEAGIGAASNCKWYLQTGPKLQFRQVAVEAVGLLK